MLSKERQNLFDSSVVPSPKQVLGDMDTVMFVAENDKIFAMGKGLAGENDRGWLREIAKPEECKDF